MQLNPSMYGTFNKPDQVTNKRSQKYLIDENIWSMFSKHLVTYSDKDMIAPKQIKGEFFFVNAHSR